MHRLGPIGPDCAIAPRSASGPDRAPIAPSGRDRAPIAPSGPDRAPIAPSGPDPAPIAPSARSGPDCAVGPRSGRDCAVTRSFALQGGILSNAGGKDGPGRSARILGGCGAVGDIARAYCFFSETCTPSLPIQKVIAALHGLQLMHNHGVLVRSFPSWVDLTLTKDGW